MSWAGGGGATALYLSPTKSLAADQMTALETLAVRGVRAATYDGDTPADERRWVRRHANYVLSNPDLVHHSLLPRHEMWAGFLRRLRYVVVDECHSYRGVTGSHVACVLRRLRRVCARYRTSPTFVFASATMSHPASQAEALCGLPVTAVCDDGSPHPGVTVAVWEPPMLPRSGGGRERRSAVAEGADVMAALVSQGAKTLSFARSRAGAEILGIAAQRVAAAADPALAGAVGAYRGGYLPEERRDLERRLRSGSLRGLAATSALELGVDIEGLDAVVIAGWPGTRASFWQRLGRAGRGSSPALGVLIADADPLDQFLVTHPSAVLDAPLEAAVLDPANPYVLSDHLQAAAEEIPLTQADVETFGPTTVPLAEELTRQGRLRRRPTGWYSVRPMEDRALPSLRGAGAAVKIVEAGTGRILGTVDSARAPASAHPGAVYLHQGKPHVIVSLDLESGTALSVAGDPGWSTLAQSVSSFDIVRPRRSLTVGPVTTTFGDVRVRSRVTSFLRRAPGGEVLGVHPLELPEQVLTTTATWWTCAAAQYRSAGLTDRQLPGALHAAEHAAIGLLPLLAVADRWDIGGVSTARHPDTGVPTILVYDGYPGGAGFAERGYEEARTWLIATSQVVSRCPCEDGCPACVQSPKCGNGNEPLDKAGAVIVLGTLLQAPAPGD